MTTVAFEELTVHRILGATKTSGLRCRDLIDYYRARIDDLDRGGPQINSMVNLNPNIESDADIVDSHYRETGRLIGPLHGVPVVVKDQILTRAIPTTFGSVAYRDHVPPNDATVIRQLRQAGAVILGKTNMPDFGASWFSTSSVAGTTKNPYSPQHSAGGSSSGTAAAVASNFAAVGIGEDSAGSIGVPSSCNNTIGLRVTTGTISRDGICPLIPLQDTAGPITRTVEDAAVLYEVLTGSSDDTRCLRGPVQARIGVLRSAFGAGAESGFVNTAVDSAIGVLESCGHHIVDNLEVPDFETLIAQSSIPLSDSAAQMNEFLRRLPAARTIEDIVAAGEYHASLEVLESIATEAPKRAQHAARIADAVEARGRLRSALIDTMARHTVDVLIYPETQIVTPTLAELADGRWTRATFPTNGVIAAQSDLPAICLPAGFTPTGIPVGFEILGKPHQERYLLRLASGYENSSSPRIPALTRSTTEGATD